MMLDTTAEKIIDEFQAWVAASMPTPSSLLRVTEAKKHRWDAAHIIL
jgi:hypothetical protein